MQFGATLAADFADNQVLFEGLILPFDEHQHLAVEAVLFENGRLDHGHEKFAM